MRIRTVKPEFWRNRKLASLGREVHGFAARLLNTADDAGYFEADPALIAGDVLPFDADAQRFIRKALPELERIGFVEIRGGECGIGRIPTFRSHQRINRPSKSRLETRWNEVPAVTGFSEPSVSPHGALSEPSSTEQGNKGTREVGTREQGKSAGADVRAVFEHWAAKVSPKAKLDDKRARVVGDRLRAGYTVEQLQRSIDGYAASPWHQGENDRRQKYLDLELMMRDSAHVERGHELANGPTTGPPKDPRKGILDITKADTEWHKTHVGEIPFD